MLVVMQQGATEPQIQAVIDRLVEGRIKETRIIMDTMGLMIQLGVVPAPGA